MTITLEELQSIVKDTTAIEDLKLVELDQSKKYLLIIPPVNQQMVESLSAAMYRLQVGVLVISNADIYETIKMFEVKRSE